ncbi:MAG TPA: hypothetical protein VEX38_03875, partial [Fimbriimonadaceae bacterium]|nr:hypothetical protein [Fimbriimonadaceae bacterium]
MRRGLRCAALAAVCVGSSVSALAQYQVVEVAPGEKGDVLAAHGGLLGGWVQSGFFRVPTVWGSGAVALVPDSSSCQVNGLDGTLAVGSINSNQTP